ncbi:MAG: prolyl oligopeptidase family serine peptidase, partial [Bacteroidota bacterium]
MRNPLFPFLLAAICVFTFACQPADSGGQDKESISMQSDFDTPPTAEKQPSTFEEHGNTRVDNYYWLKNRDNPEVINYLESENSYAEDVMSGTAELQNTLFEELKGRIKEEDESLPYFDNGYYYYNRTEEGQQYPIYCRKKGSMDAEEEVLIDGNKMVEGKEAFILSALQVSPDNNIMVYAYNYTGSYVEYTIAFKNLETGEILSDQLEATGNIQWANDSKTIFFARQNDALRYNRIFKYEIGSNKEELVYEEEDELFSCYISKTTSRDYLMIYSGSFTTSEIQIMPADQPNGQFTYFAPRTKDLDYSLDHHDDRFVIRYKDPENKNAKLMEAPNTGYEDKASWKDIVPHDPKVLIEGFSIFKDYLVYNIRTNGLEAIRYMNWDDRKVEEITFPEPVYTVSYSGQPMGYKSDQMRYSYSSLNRPYTTYRFNLSTGESTIEKETEIPSGFNPDEYVVERTFATAEDGVKVPMALLYRKGLEKDGKNPVHIYSYGSYGSSTDAYFRSSIISLVDRGFVYAIAQIRGGSEMGEDWYEQGKLLNKMNTFTDFIACTEHLIDENYTNKDLITASGGSAGGLLMGAVANMRPDLYEVIVARVPFVDVINTILDES